MAQISSRNGFKQSTTSTTGPSAMRTVNKEEALQMEAEALAKLQKERLQSVKEVSVSVSVGSACSKLPNAKHEHDLIHFPEAENFNKHTADTLSDRDIEKLTAAELEKLLLDKSFGHRHVTRPHTLPNTPLLSPSFSSQFYSQAPFSGGQWTGGLHRPVAQTASYRSMSVTFPKSLDPFQNGFYPAQTTYRPSEPVCVGLHAKPYLSFPLQPSTPIRPHTVLPIYGTVTPELANLYNKIASTSEYLKNSKSNSDLQSANTMTPKLPCGESSSDVSKFDWLDLDPLSKARMESVELVQSTAEAGHKVDTGAAAGDPWEQVLQKQTPSESCQPDAKADDTSFKQQTGKPTHGPSVTRSLSLNLRSTSSQISHRAQGPTTKTLQVPFLFLVFLKKIYFALII